MEIKITLTLTLVTFLVNSVICMELRKRFGNQNSRFDWKGMVAKQQDALGEMMKDRVHGVKMGIPYRPCDDGVHDIEVDWDPHSKAEMTCYPGDQIELKTKFVNITDKSDMPSIHECLLHPINYPTNLPLSGKHRPLWPKYGEYSYVPPQRWVHSLEHGAIVFLYHPCKQDAPEQEALKSLVRDCLGKHIISPYRKIPRHMPYAILSYEHALLVGQFDPQSENDVNVVLNFIKTYALNAPEGGNYDDGQYSIGLIRSAYEFSDLKESGKAICEFLK